MPIDLGPQFPTTWQGRPPHMAPADLGLWHEWRKKGLDGATAMFFDVAFGDGAPAPSGTAPDLARAWGRMTALRADVVLEFPTHWLIVELRGHAGASALGAVLTYVGLWKKEPPDARPVSGLIVTDFVNGDAVAAADAAGVPTVGLGPV